MTELKALKILEQEKDYQASFEYPDYNRISELNEAITELEALQEENEHLKRMLEAYKKDHQ